VVTYLATRGPARLEPRDRRRTMGHRYSIRGNDKTLDALPLPASTPVSLALPPGTYQVTLTGPAPEARVVTLTASVGGVESASFRSRGFKHCRGGLLRTVSWLGGGRRADGSRRCSPSQRSSGGTGRAASAGDGCPFRSTPVMRLVSDRLLCGCALPRFLRWHSPKTMTPSNRVCKLAGTSGGRTSYG
jgi:hypothetical protein